ncbi:hypothetical protein [Paracoccus yeei]|nr:hypothetical protein [Paracoccus yeei]
MTLAPKFDRRIMLAADPKSFDDLLDLFSAYVATIAPPIHKGHDMLREEIGAGEHVALGHIFGVACDAEDMAKRLQQIRAARGAEPDVSLVLDRTGAGRLADAIGDLPGVISDAAGVMDYLHAPDQTGAMKGMEAEAAGILSLCSRGLRAFIENDCDALWRAEVALRAAASHREEAA